MIFVPVVKARWTLCGHFLPMVLGERDFNVIYVSASASFSIDYSGKIIRIKRKRNNKSLSPSTITLIFFAKKLVYSDISGKIILGAAQ